jgi:hypothetical protein
MSIYFLYRLGKIIMVNVEIKIFVSYLLFVNIKMNDSFVVAFENQHAVRVVNNLSQRIFIVFNACPTFLRGDMQDALDKAFCHDSVQEVRCRHLS